MRERWKVPIKSNKDLIEIAFEQIEKETGFHIINKEYNDDEYTEKVDQNTICEFYIKEIPGFRFAFWNARRSKNKSDWFKEEHIEWLNGLDLDYLTELIFFTQYERDLDKFRPSRSGFVIGIHRNEYLCKPDPNEEEIEPFDMFELTKALKYIKKHRIRSVEYAGCQTRYIWEDDRSSFRLLRQFIHDWIYEWKHRFKEWLKLKYAIFISKHYMKKLTQFNYIIKDHGNGCYPRIDVTVRRKDKIEINLYNRDWDILDKVDDKYFNLFNLQWLQYDIDENATEEIIQKDKSCRDNFFWYCYKNINEPTDDLDSKIIAYSVETIEDINEIIKRKDKEFEK